MCTKKISSLSCCGHGKVNKCLRQNLSFLLLSVVMWGLFQEHTQGDFISDKWYLSLLLGVSFCAAVVGGYGWMCFGWWRYFFSSILECCCYSTAFVIVIRGKVFLPLQILDCVAAPGGWVMAYCYCTAPTAGRRPCSSAINLFPLESCQRHILYPV